MWETDITILSTQTILFNACCLRKSKGYRIPSHSDSFHFFPFFVGVRGNEAYFGGLVVILHFEWLVFLMLE